MFTPPQALQALPPMDTDTREVLVEVPGQELELVQGLEQAMLRALA